MRRIAGGTWRRVARIGQRGRGRGGAAEPIDGRGVLLERGYVAVDGQPAALEARVVRRQPQIAVDGGRVGVDADAGRVGVAVLEEPPEAERVARDDARQARAQLLQPGGGGAVRGVVERVRGRSEGMGVQ